MERIKTVLIGLFLFLSVTGVASAADIFGADIAVDVQPVMMAAQVVVIGIASIWGIKKVISVLNKS